MPASTPPVIVEPFAVNGLRNVVPVDSLIPTIPGRASYNDGFPPLTMTPLASGGIPPFGRDMNGILYAISAHTAWQQGGGRYVYSSTFSTANTGYAVGATLQSSTNPLVSYVNTIAGNTANPDSDRTGWSTIVAQQFNLAQFGAPGDGTDQTDAIRECYEAAAAASIALEQAVIVVWPPGEYLVSERIVIQGAIKGITTLAYGATMRTDEAIGTEIPALHFGYELSPSAAPYDAANGRIATSVCTANVVRTSRTVTVTSTVGMARGQAITLSSSGEYFFGITGDSGNNVRFKSELNYVRSVDSATQLTLEHFPEDNYDAGGYVLTASTYHQIHNVHFRGLEIVGVGQGSSHPNPFGPNAIWVEWCENVSFCDGTMRNFNATPWRDYQCWGTRIHNNYILGRDSTDPTNVPTISVWFYGPGSHGSCLVSFTDNICVDLRRAQDLGPIGATTVARHIVQANNNITGGENGIGAHMCQYVTAVGNEITDSVSGYFYRAKDIEIIGGRVKMKGTNASDSIVVFGSVPGGTYTENPDMGALSIRGVVGWGTQNFVKVQNGFSSLDIVGCEMVGNNTYFAWMSCKQVKHLRIRGCLSDMSTRSLNRFNVYVENDSDNPLTVLDGVEITNNVLINGAEGVRIDGANANTAPAQHISISNNTFPACSVGTPTACIRMGESGFYDGSTINLGPNNYWSAASRNIRLVGSMYRYTQLPLIDQTIKAGGYATSSAMASSSWGAVAHTNVVKGTRVLNSDIDAGEYSAWIMTAAGTFGTITAATTGSIGTGTAALTLNDNTDNRASVGTYLTVAGAGVASADLTARVIAVSGTAVTLDTNASTTVVAAAVSYTAPTVKGLGLVEA